MMLRAALMLALAAAGSVAALAQEGEAPPPEIKAQVESCSARKFETSVEFTVDGRPRRSKLSLCGKEGQSDADWARTLTDARKKVEANQSLAPEAKSQILAALESEIAKFAPIAAPAIALGPPPVARPAERPPEYAVLPPLPAPKAGPVISAAAAAAAAAPSRPLPPKPRLTLQCRTMADMGGAGPCTTLGRDVTLTVRAGEPIPPGTLLRFERRGGVRSDVSIAQLRKGQSRDVRLPPQLCARVVRSQVEILLVRQGDGLDQTLGSEGQYQLRC